MMPEYIERAEAVKAMEELLQSPYGDGSPFIRFAFELVRDMFADKVPNGMKVPSADVVPVVRCKDCKFAYWNKEGKWFYCYAFSRLNEKDYCSQGKRKVEND